jgi:hypothetical protein
VGDTYLTPPPQEVETGGSRFQSSPGKSLVKASVVGHFCNPSYLGNRDLPLEVSLSKLAGDPI